MSVDPRITGYVCLGASAGGLRSLEAIVRHVPADFPWPILISQHLQADRVSQMPEILGRVAHVQVREAISGETPAPGVVYTCPSGSEMGLTMDGQISLRPPTPGQPQRIDHLFSTASYARPGRTIAVVLSGTGSDGAVGSLVVKLNGGTVIAESSASAQHASMPAAAQRAIHVDATLDADHIAPLLVDLARGSMDEATAAATATIARLASEITRPGETDFTHYRPSTLRRQADKRRAVLGIGTLDAYREHVALDPAERTALVESLLVPVTAFFRDPAAWRGLEELVIPTLAQHAREGKTIRVWCVGCASGEEAYSVAILLAESIADRSRVHVLGTDLDASAIAAAREGVFDASRMESVDTLRRERFFHAVEGKRYHVTQDLRDLVEFRVHDATRDDAPARFDLILCRNLLIYFDDELQARTLDVLRDALVGPRILVLGRSEAIPTTRTDFAPVARSLRIFHASGPAPESSDGAAKDAAPPSLDGPIVAPSDALVLIVDDAWIVLDANANARDHIDPDLVGKSVLDLFPRWQGSPMHDALRATTATGRSLRVRGAPTPQGPMDVTLEPVPRADRQTILVATPATPRRPASTPTATTRRAAPRSPDVDLTATNDELQTANEELAATNEELQATNEELASLNEEFQATNQTLASTNVELGEVAKSAQTATDLVNEFLQSWREAIIACDATQRVTLYNRRASALFGLDASSLGRPLQLAAIGLTGPEIDAALRRAANAPPERVTITHESGTLAMTIEHVRSANGVALGWVLTWSPT